MNLKEGWQNKTVSPQKLRRRKQRIAKSVEIFIKAWYCNAGSVPCQAFSRLKIWTAIDKEKGEKTKSLLSRTYKRAKTTKVKIILQISVAINVAM